LQEYSHRKYFCKPQGSSHNELPFLLSQFNMGTTSQDWRFHSPLVN
jgi:hypothetical protein